MRLEELKVGKGIEIYITRQEYRYHLTSKVEGAVLGKIYASLLTFGSGIFAFKPKDYIEIVYKDKDKMWKWSDVKAGIDTLEGHQAYCFECFKPGTSYNRRDTFRVQVMAPVELMHFSPIDSNANMDNFNMDAPAKNLVELGIEKSIVNVVVKDISESGAGFYSPIPMKVGDRIRIRFQTEFGLMICEGSIIRAMKNTWSKYHLFYGCTFVKTDKNLSKYIFAQQRQQLQRER